MKTLRDKDSRYPWERFIIISRYDIVIKRKSIWQYCAQKVSNVIERDSLLDEILELSENVLKDYIENCSEFNLKFGIWEQKSMFEFRINEYYCFFGLTEKKSTRSMSTFCYRVATWTMAKS